MNEQSWPQEPPCQPAGVDRFQCRAPGHVLFGCRAGLPCLACTDRAHAGQPAFALYRPVIVIGSGKKPHILLDGDSVSHSHTIIVQTRSGAYFRDLASRTHTILNGKPQREAPLKIGDTLTIGDYVFNYVTTRRPADLEPAAPARWPSRVSRSRCRSTPAPSSSATARAAKSASSTNSSVRCTRSSSNRTASGSSATSRAAPAPS
ncbi:MAG: FHA domain-containing protein [Tepidisphaeraceae bacterium]